NSHTHNTTRSKGDTASDNTQHNHPSHSPQHVALAERATHPVEMDTISRINNDLGENECVQVIIFANSRETQIGTNNEEEHGQDGHGAPVVDQPPCHHEQGSRH